MQEWEMIGFVSSSEPRLKILVHIKSKASTPTNMAHDLEIPISRVSVILKELIERGLIECLTPELRKGKLFKATDEGKKILKALHEMTDIGD